MADRRGGKRPGAGRPRGSVSNNSLKVRRLFSEHAEDAIDVIVELMADMDTPSVVRLNAAKFMIERAWGRVKDEDYLHEENDQNADNYKASIREVLTDEEYSFLTQINEKLEQANK